MMRNLSFFPVPYPNEDFRSIIHRYHIRSGETSFLKTSKTLFDTFSSKNVYFNQNIFFFINRLNNPEVDIDYLLDQHTIFPVIKPFISEERNVRFHQSAYRIGTMKNKNIWWNNIAQSIRYCPDCLEEDYYKYGEAYVHRLHQFEMLDYCYRHYFKLLSNCEVCGAPLSKNHASVLLKTTFCENGHNIAEQKTKKLTNTSFIREIIEDLLYIKENSSNLNRYLITDLFYIALGHKGYINCKTGQIYREKLKEAFQTFLAKHQVNHIFNQQVDIVTERFSMFVSKKINRAPNLLTYILLIKFLSKTAKRFIEPDYSYSVSIPFGNKAQPCLNKLCNYYKKDVIKKYNKTYYSAYVKGTFECIHCGYIYGRKWIWSKDEKSGTIQRVFLISRGELWQKKVMILYDQGCSIRDIAILTEGYEDPIKQFLKEKLGDEYYVRFHPKNNTLYKHILREKNKNPTNYCTANSLDDRRLIIRRQQILKLTEESPLLSRKEIKEKARADYDWLMKYDREWMNENLPKPFNK